MVLFKSCPRCRGDLTVNLNHEVTCLQCGYELRPQEVAALRERLRARRLASPAARAA